MSGRKQHFIPQSLLRGFSREGKGSKQQVVAYTYDRGIFTAATDGIGAERNFYSELVVDGEIQTLDDKITDFETPLADVLVEFRALADGAGADTLKAATFVTHLTIRNDHFRKLVSSGSIAMFDGVQASMSDEQTAKALLGLARDRPSALFRDAMKKPLAEHAATLAALGLREDQLIEWAFDYAKANFSKFHKELIAPMHAAFADFGEGKMLEMAADAQRRALDSDLSPKAWIEQLSKMDWRVSHRDLPLILPDCVSVAIDNAGKAQPLMLIDKEAIIAIVVPISSQRLLIGSRDQAPTLPDDMNAVFAACSWDFFVGIDRNADCEALSKTIRKGVQQLMDELVSDALDDSVQRHSDANSRM